MGPPAGGLVRGRNVAGWESRGEEEPGQHPRVDCTHVSHVSPLSTLYVSGVHWAGLLLAGDWPSLCPAPTTLLLLLGPAQPSTLTLTKPFQKTLKTRYLHIEIQVSICTDIFAHIYCNARPLSPLQQGVCPRLLRMRRSRVCRAQAPAPGGDMPMSAETELDCLVTTPRGHVPGHVTCRAHVMLIMITMGLQLHFACCHQRPMSSS